VLSLGLEKLIIEGFCTIFIACQLFRKEGIASGLLLNIFDSGFRQM
jgi:hypothetical protein